MIDFHTHILPYMDDGAKNADESVAMLEKEIRQGVDTIVLTSHFYSMEDSPDNFIERQNKAYNHLRQKLTDKYVRLVLGAEVQYFEGISLCDSLDIFKIGSTDYMLLEMPFQKWNGRMFEELVKIQQSGINIILAHIERYEKCCSFGMLENIVNEGIIIQSNASFFINIFTRRKALSMLARGRIHLIGSDCHNLTDRAPNVGKAYEIISKKLGTLAVDKIDDLGRKILKTE